MTASIKTDKSSFAIHLNKNKSVKFTPLNLVDAL